jgi:hypothetical protein
MTMNSILRALGRGILATACVVGAAGCSSDPHPTTPVGVHIDMSLSDPRVLVSVGGDHPVLVLLDTGSVGLRVLDTAVPSGSGSEIDLSSQPDRYVFANGTVLRGFVARAVVHIGRLTTTTPVPFQSISRVVCVASLPHCPRLPKDVVGTLGIGMTGNAPGLPINPLLTLPAPYDQSWAVRVDRRGSGGRLTLGAAAPRSPEAVLDLSANENSPQYPTRAWNDAPRMCWRIATRKQCGVTALDTGSNPVYVTGYPHAPPKGLDLSSGRAVTLSAPDTAKPVWTFTSGSPCCSRRAVVLQPGRRPTLDTGIAFFQTHVVTYDNRRGVIDIN